MNGWHLVWRSLVYDWRLHVWTALGGAAAAGVLCGALMVGRSAPETLRKNLLSGLGDIDAGILFAGGFPADLAQRLEKDAGWSRNVERTAAVSMRQAVAARVDEQAQAPHVRVMGVDERFWEFFPRVNQEAKSQNPGVKGRRVALNRRLAEELGVCEGDALLVCLERPQWLPLRSVFFHRRKDEALQSLRVEVAAVLPDRGAGGFRLDSGSAIPRNLFIDRGWLNQDRDEAQALVWHGRKGCRVDDRFFLETWRKVGCPADGGWVFKCGEGELMAQGTRVLLPPRLAESLEKMAKQEGADAGVSSVYLAERMEVKGGARSLAYAMVAGVQDRGLPMKNSEMPPIWLGAWAAEDLGVGRKDLGIPVRVVFPLPDGEGRILSKKQDFMLAGVLGMDDPVLAGAWTPEFPGMTDSRKIGDWRLPFPIDWKRITRRDEIYWEKYRAAPKVFVPLAVAQNLWGSVKGGSHGKKDGLTGVRLRPPPGMTVKRLESRLSRRWLENMDFSAGGMEFRNLRQQALRAAAGTVDFAMLMTGMSFFLVAASAAFSAFMAHLLVIRRLGQMGVMRTVGGGETMTRRVVLWEIGVSGMVGCCLGAPAGVGYAKGLVALMNLWWSGAMGGLVVDLHVDAASLGVGLLGGGVLTLGMIWHSFGLAGRLTVRQQLQGLENGGGGESEKAHDWTWRRAFGLTLAAAILGTWTWFIDDTAGQAAVFFCVGILVLAGGLAWMHWGIVRTWKGRGVVAGPWALAWRGVARQRTRSLLLAGTLGGAAFVLATAGLNTVIPDDRKASGGFALRMACDFALRHPLDSPAGRRALGFSEEEERLFSGVRVEPFWLSDGDDVSCRNVAKPAQPRFLGTKLKNKNFNFKNQGGGEREEGVKNKNHETAVPAWGDADAVRWNLGAKAGDVLVFRDGRGGPLRVKIEGVLTRSLFAGELVIDEADFLERFPDERGPRWFLLAVPNDRVEQARRVLQRRLAEYGADVVSTKEVLAGYAAAQNAYLRMFLVLGGMGLLLGTLGTAAVLWRGILERTRELALLNAVGFSRRWIVGLLWRENALVYGGGIVWGTLAGFLAGAPGWAALDGDLPAARLFVWMGLLFLSGFLACGLASRLVLSERPARALRRE
ncbi:MAG: ABC transporter permease [Verrucomicrobiae bacterium]|nr:ABC transporter permease [Verrucomicrobiae bacterium]